MWTWIEDVRPPMGKMQLLGNNQSEGVGQGSSGRQWIPNISALRLQVQLTDFENSAYVVFVVLLTRVILSYKLDFLIPLSKVQMGVLTLMNMHSVDGIHCPV